MKSLLNDMHPIVLFFYFGELLFFVVCAKHPWIVITQTVSLLILFFYYETKKKRIVPYLFLTLIFALSNPIFVSRGRTVLFANDYLRITKEALFYGIQSGCVLLNVLLVFYLFSFHFKREHWVYLFGKLFPKLGIIFSMSLRLFPKYKKQAKAILDCQKNLTHHGPVRRGLETIGMETTWAFESSMDQLDSMNARGYGLKKRTHFHLFSFQYRELRFLIELILIFSFNFYGYQRFYRRFFYYPMILWRPFEVKDLFFIILMILTFFLPGIWKEVEIHVRHS